MEHAEPDVRPLGYLALGTAILSAALSATYFFSPLTYLAATIALPLGFISRSDPRTRRMGSIAIVVTVLAIVVATGTLVAIE